jgi:mono/diheme cytochrome c family protein
MLKSLSVIALTGALAVSAGYADQSNAKVVIQVDKTAPVDGKQMYTNYCAPCHGNDGRGGGPVAPALNQKPIDLTTLTKTNGGKFPASHVVSVLEFGSEMPAHGSALMPVWGPVLSKMDQQRPDQRLLRISNLSEYLRSMQTK